MQQPTEANDKLRLDQLHFVFSYLGFLGSIFLYPVPGIVVYRGRRRWSKTLSG